MNSPSTDALRLFSTLLLYPDTALLGRLDEIEAAVINLPAGDIQNAVTAFTAYLKANDPIRLQETYTAAFDMNPKSTLNLTYHLFGDTEKRGTALAHLQTVYGRAGWERTATELPDYLPLMLEFLSLCAIPELSAQVWEFLRGTASLVTALNEIAPAYAALLVPLAMIIAETAAMAVGEGLFSSTQA